MSERYRHSVATLAGLAALWVALGSGAYFGSLYAPDHKQYGAVGSDGAGSQDYRGPSQSLPDIAGLPGPVERAIANPPPATGKDSEKRDLAAQEASALWSFWMVVISALSVGVTTFGTILLYQQIVLTREAVQDTGDATVAMKKANEIAHDAQRAWVTLAIEPRKAFPLPAGNMAIHIDLSAKNIGHTTASNFNLESEIFFMGQSESQEGILDRVHAQLDTWKSEYWHPENASLLPQDTEIDRFQYKAKLRDLGWWKNVPYPMTRPIFLAAAFYRTVADPSAIQLSWRTWYLGHARQSGEVVAHILQLKDPITAPVFVAIPMHTSLMHEAYPAKNDGEGSAEG